MTLQSRDPSPSYKYAMYSSNATAKVYERANLNKSIMLAFIDVFGTNEFKRKFSVENFQLKEFYKWLLEVELEPARTWSRLCRKRLSAVHA